MNKRTKDYLLLILLMLLIVFASIGVYHVFAPTPTHEQSFDTRKVIEPIEEKDFLYKNKDAMSVLENDEIKIGQPFFYTSYNNGEKTFAYLDKKPDYSSIQFLKTDGINYNLNVDLIKNRDTIKVNLKLKLSLCTKRQNEEYYSYTFNALMHPWVKKLIMDVELRNNEYFLATLIIQQDNDSFDNGRTYSFNF